MPSLLFLASRSPRRVDMLRSLGYRFESVPADIDETPLHRESPAAFARRMALGKARTAAALVPFGAYVLGADTDVSLDGEILGKPRDRAHGLELLARLSGRSHRVCSAVTLWHQGQAANLLTETEVEFGPIAAAEAEAYWDSGEPMDKAGGYAIQGGAARWVRAIRGSYSGVIGLPLVETCALLSDAGLVPGGAA